MQPTLISRRDIFKLLAAASAAGAMLPPHLVAQEKALARGDAWYPDFLKKTSRGSSPSWTANSPPSASSAKNLSPS